MIFILPIIHSSEREKSDNSCPARANSAPDPKRRDLTGVIVVTQPLHSGRDEFLAAKFLLLRLFGHLFRVHYAFGEKP